jgi:hypothetical protein
LAGGRPPLALMCPTLNSEPMLLSSQANLVYLKKRSHRWPTVFESHLISIFGGGGSIARSWKIKRHADHLGTSQSVLH